MDIKVWILLFGVAAVVLVGIIVAIMKRKEKETGRPQDQGPQEPPEPE